jgi:hypothetical protein
MAVARAAATDGGSKVLPQEGQGIIGMFVARWYLLR